MKLRFNGSFLGLGRPYDFDTFDNALTFITNYMERNTVDEDEQHEIVLIDYKKGRSYTPFYKLINNEWVEVDYCNHDKCGLHPVSELREFIYERTYELLCEKHYELMEDNDES